MLGYNVTVPPHVRQGLFSRSFDNDDLLPRLRKPVLIVQGAQDAVIKAAAADQHKAAIGHAVVQVMPNVGHTPFWEDAAAFNLHIRTFCDQLELQAV
jgi:non-heme chloroperoxidase